MASKVNLWDQVQLKPKRGNGQRRCIGQLSPQQCSITNDPIVQWLTLAAFTSDSHVCRLTGAALPTSAGQLDWLLGRGLVEVCLGSFFWTHWAMQGETVPTAMTAAQAEGMLCHQAHVKALLQPGLQTSHWPKGLEVYSSHSGSRRKYVLAK